MGTGNGLFQVAGGAEKSIEVGAGLGPPAVHDIAEDRVGPVRVGGSRLQTLSDGVPTGY